VFLKRKKIVPMLVLAGFSIAAQNGGLHYPPGPKSDHVDDYNGVKIADPYRGLEDADSPSTQKWVEEENKLTFGYLAKLSGRDKIKEQLTQLWDYERYGPFSKAGPNYFYSHNSGLQNQPVVFVTRSVKEPGKVLLDPNTYRKDGTAAQAGATESWGGKLYAYSIAQAGSDWQEWHVRDVDSGKDHGDVIGWSKSGGVAWNGDDSGFYYSRFPEPPPEKLLTVAALNSKIYFHRLGDSQAADKLIYERPEHPNWGLYPIVMEGGRYVVFYIYTGVEGTNMLAYQDLGAPEPRTVDLIGKNEHAYDPIAAIGSLLYLRTNDGAPRGRVIAIDLQHSERSNWKEIVPEAPETLENVQMADDRLLLEYMKDAHSAARLVTTEGKPLDDVQLPGLGTAVWSSPRLRDKEAFYLFTTFTAPATIYRLNLETGRSDPIRETKTAFEAANYETEQVFYPSKDGTRIPMFLTYRKGLKRDGQNPTLLYAYGGFDIALTPSFSPAIAEWLRMGGIYAEANLRGGSEYGEAWHQAGMRDKKQNVFDDFIAAAEWLIANKYTSIPKLAIFGGSNGGLLVGAVLNQRPDLFGAAMPSVGVMDMLRFNKFGFGTQWVGEYGSPENPKDFAVMRAYSPLHNIRTGVKYPPVLITTSDHDDRVMPGHSLKYAATLQQAQEGSAPILIRIETRAGHGAGKPTSKIIDEWADRLTFLRSALHMDSGF
jgi:prolyl oligopeptidase